jgi:hypothetical protein
VRISDKQAASWLELKRWPSVKGTIPFSTDTLYN